MKENIKLSVTCTIFVLQVKRTKKLQPLKQDGVYC